MEFEAIRKLIDAASFGEASKWIKVYDSFEKLEGSDEIELLLLKGHLENKQANFQKALDFSTEALKKSKKIGNQFLSVDALILIAEIYYRLGDLDEGEKLVNEGEKILESIEKALTPNQKCLKVADLYNCKGNLLLGRSELDQALDLYHQSFELCEIVNNKHKMARAFHNIGVIFNLKGELDKGLEVYQRSLIIDEEISNIRGIAISHNNIGEIYRAKGELDLATSHYEKSLEYSNQIVNAQLESYAKHNLGLTLHLKRKYAESRKYFKESLETSEKIGNIYDISETLFVLIKLEVETENLGVAKTYLNKLEEIRKTSDNPFIDQIYRLSNAIILKEGIRAINKVEAQKIFLEISEEELVDQEFTVYAMLNLYDLLLDELKSTGSEEIIDELKALSSKLLKIAKEQNSFAILAETYLVESKLALLELNLEEAEKLLLMAEKVALDKGLQRLAYLISDEHDNFNKQINKWEGIVAGNLTLAERMELTNLQERLNMMIGKRYEITSEEKDEEPVLVLILNEGGVSLFTEKFQEESKLDGYLVGSFLTAFDNFSREAFAVSGSLERIKHQDYTMLMKKLDTLTFCYAFKGQSFVALQKLDTFIAKLISLKETWEIILETGISYVDPHVEKELSSVANNIFT